MCWAVLFSHGVIVLAYKHAASQQEILSYARFSRLISPTQKFWDAYQDIRRSWFTRIATLLVKAPDPAPGPASGPERKTPEAGPDTTPERPDPGH